MSQPEWQQLSLGLHSQPFSGGKKRASSKRSKHPRVNADTTSIQLSLLDLTPEIQEQLFSTLGFPATLKKLISLNKQSIFCLVTPHLNSSQKSAQDSTSSGKSFLPYWNEFSVAMSEWLSLPTETGYVDLGSILSHGSLAAPSVKFWFSTKRTLVQSERWSKMCWQSSTSSAPDSTDCESISKQSKLIQNLQVKMYPPQKLASIWRTWVTGTRRVYNATIAYLNQNGVPKTKDLLGKGDLKKRFRSFILNSDLIEEWVKKDVPSDPKQNAVFEALAAYKKTKPRLNKETGAEEMRAKFRSVRDPQQTMQFDDGAFKRGTWLYTRTMGLRPKTVGQSSCPWEWLGGTELTYRKGEWFGSFPTTVDAVDLENDGFIGLDPGVRCFLTGFDGNQFLEFGNGDFSRIAKLCHYLDKLKSKHDLAKGWKFNKFRYRLRQSMARLRRKIKALVDECHKQTAHYLATNYKVIALPTFETSQMVAKKSRKLKSKTARAMMTWAFFRFSQVLEYQCQKSGAVLIRHTEEYTSKTCTSCGHIHHKLGSKKTFICPKCGNTLPRDFNGAVGNFLKALWDTTLLSSVEDSTVMFELSSNVGQCSN